MKIGDKLLCKKSLMTLHFNVGNEYKIVDIRPDEIIIEHPYPLSHVRFETQAKDTFSIYIWDYFYTPSEIRQLKLQQVQDENR
jgi:hypothetical protein